MPRHSQRYKVGDYVMCKWPDSAFYFRGMVKAVATNSYSIAFEDGNVLDLPPKHVHSERSFRSKSPSRKSRSRSRSRGRSRGRSRSPARTAKAKQTPSPSPSRKTRSETKEPKVKASPQVKSSSSPVQRRSSQRLAEKALQQENGEKNDENNKSENKADAKEVKPAKKGFAYEFGGPIGATCLTLGLPAFLMYINLACNKSGCDVKKIPSIPMKPDSYFDPQAAGIFVGWVAFQALLAVAPFGKVVQGLPVKGGKRLQYRCNGFWSLLLSIAVLGSLVYFKYPVTILYKKFFQLAVSAMAFSFGLSVLLWVKARNSSVSKLAEGGQSGCPTYDFFIGRELNPRVGPLDLKFFCELRPGLIGWVMLNLSFVLEAEQTGNYSPALGLVVFFQGIYVADALFFESAILSTMDITHDGFGFMLAFGDLAWVPFVYCLQTRYILEHPQNLPYWALAGIFLLWVVGYAIFRGSNSQKDQFRKNPHDPALAHLKTIPGGHGKPLLVSGWWGLCRHPNYLGDLIMALTWSLCTGFQSVIPYFYPVYFLGLLVHRAMRDDANCRKKHGSAWDRYCERVPYKIFPKVF